MDAANLALEWKNYRLDGVQTGSALQSAHRLPSSQLGKPG
jgi:hypothetical protein